nr:hypothetical protein [uncultured Sphingomonas sp.]
MPMAFLLDRNRRVRQGRAMPTILRTSLFALTLGALGALWVIAGPMTAIAAGFATFAYVFVLAMKSAAAEILRFEREQRPDLCA